MKKINDREFDFLIKNNMKEHANKINLRKEIILKIEEYEAGKAGRYYSFEKIIAFFTIIASITSIYMFEYGFSNFKYLLLYYNLNFYLVKFIFYGIFMAIIAILIVGTLLNKKNQKIYIEYSGNQLIAQVIVS